MISAALQAVMMLPDRVNCRYLMTTGALIAAVSLAWCPAGTATTWPAGSSAELTVDFLIRVAPPKVAVLVVAS